MRWLLIRVRWDGRVARMLQQSHGDVLAKAPPNTVLTWRVRRGEALPAAALQDSAVERVKLEDLADSDELVVTAWLNLLAAHAVRSVLSEAGAEAWILPSQRHSTHTQAALWAARQAAEAA